MILHINGDINRYYVQTLCMIFFPGAKFSQNEELRKKLLDTGDADLTS